jgi:hydrogenase maturation protease
MHLEEGARCAVRVVGVGSAHGDDRAGWLVAEQLAAEPSGGVEVTSAGDPLRLVSLLDGCARLIVVDACRSGRPAGTVVRTTWAEVRRGLAGAPGADAGPSSHGLGVAEALGLAEALGRLPDPAAVALVGIEAGEGLDDDRAAAGFAPMAEPSPAVMGAVPTACRLVRELIALGENPGDRVAPG